ncbi:MAG: NAD(P)/FAD-dependent oxidoreductase [Peptococcaceae bacterium]|nr:NAD(P)/FAD-dependent oxidoreductase [Peptococcaceae bacterium]
MIRISNIKVAAQKDQKKVLEQEICRMLRIKSLAQSSYHIVKKSIDARKKESIQCIYTVDVAGLNDEAKLVAKCKKDNISIAKQERYAEPVHGDKKLANRPVVVGAGPAGLFAALLLAEHGYQPLLLERGQDVDTRSADVEQFWKTGVLNVKSNVQFGEGGAGTFSDGKLNSVIKDIRCRKVLETFVRFGAPEEILYNAKPHIGTDRLKLVVKAMREAIIAAGGEVRFGAQMTALQIQDGVLTGIEVNGDEKIPCNTAILAIGHSARDTFAGLHQQKIAMEQKAFAIGVRIEHQQKMINMAQYGMEVPYDSLGAADYKLTYQTEAGRAVYSFCMCPGGKVVAAASEDGMLAVNGMSDLARDGENANSALVVNVTPEDFPGNDVLAGVEFQRQWERAAYNLSGSYKAPVQLAGDFLNDKPSTAFGSVIPSYRPDTVFCELKQCLPGFVTEALKEALPAFGRKIKGYDNADAVLTGVETRTSSPVRIVRDEAYQSPSAKGLYPCGEGAGYAGGIMSAAVDGIRLAEQIIKEYAPVNK